MTIDIKRYSEKFDQREPSGASFRVVYSDPEGSGAEWLGLVGETITNADRCCKNCSIIFGSLGDASDVGPFVPGELEPLNEEARQVQALIDAHRDLLKAKR